MNEEVEKLAVKIEALEKPLLSCERKAEIKAHLLQQIRFPLVERESLYWGKFILSLKVVFSTFIPTNIQKTFLKERIFTLIENRSQKQFFWSNLLLFNKKLLSTVLTLAIVFLSYSYLNVDTSVVRAATFTMLDTYSGDILIERDGEFVEAKNGMHIFEKDRIITGKYGNAVIRYFDNSVSRLANNTEVIINKLARVKGSLANSYVEISLVEGNLWSKVVNLVESKSFFVVEALDIYASAARAAFNVSVRENGDLEIGVYKNSVEVKDRQAVQKVLSGKKVFLENGNKKLEQVTELGIDEKNNSWVKENLENDQLYLTEVEQRLVSAKMKAVGIEGNKDFSFEQSLREETAIFLTFDDVKKKKLKLDLYEKNFIAAQVKLHKKDLSDAENEQIQYVMQEFSLAVKDFYRLVDEISKTDYSYGVELKTYVDEKILAQKMDLGVILPTAPDYQAKKLIEDIELSNAKDEIQVAEIKAEQAAEKLVIAEEVKDNYDQQIAAEVVGHYREDINGAINIFSGLSEGDVEQKEKKTRLAEKLSANIDLLDAIDVLSQHEVNELKEDVSNALPGKDVIVDSNLDLELDSASTQGGINSLDATDSPVFVGAKVDKAKSMDKVSGEISKGEAKALEIESKKEIEPIKKGAFGIKIKGDKILDPLF